MMEMKADKSHVLMSEVLKGTVPELEDEQKDQVENLIDGYVLTELKVRFSPDAEAMGVYGVMRGVLLGDSPEIELRVQIKDAMQILKTAWIEVVSVTIEHEGTIILIPGSFAVKAIRMDEISPAEQLCTLGMHLKPAAR